MNFWKNLTCFPLILLAGAGASGAPVPIEADGMFLVDGQRTFILGLYENPKEDEVLAAVAEAGANLMQTDGRKEPLDRLHAHGLRAWVNTGMRIDLSAAAEARKKELRDMVAQAGAHPALLVWEVPDEALWNCWYVPSTYRLATQPAQLREAIEKLDDRNRAAELSRLLDTSRERLDRLDYAEGERLADEVSAALGIEPRHGPSCDLSKAAAREKELCRGLRKGYTFLRDIDPDHPVWMNHAPRNSIGQLAAYARAADIVGCDIYPAPESSGIGHSDLANRSLSSVGDYTERMRESAPGKPVWMVLQGFGWHDLGEGGVDDDGEPVMRRPTWNETRFMAYDAIVRGARGILYWGTYKVEKDSEFWPVLLRMFRELADRQPLLSARDVLKQPDVSLMPGMNSQELTVRVLAKQVGNRPHLIVVNESRGPEVYTVHGLSAPDGTRYADTDAGVEAAVEGGSLTLAIRPFEVHVLAPSQ